MASFGLAPASIVSLFLETMFFAFFVVLFCTTLWVLIWHRTSEHINKPMMATSVLMLIFATMHIAIDLRRMLDAFVVHASLPGGAEAYLEDLRNSRYMFKSAVYMLQTLVGDSFSVFRLYIIWKKQWRVCVLPLSLLVASLITGAGFLANLAQSPPSAVVFMDNLRRWIIAFFVFTFLSQVVCTALIWYRIRQLEHGMADSYVRRNLKPTMAIVVESGAVYALTLFTLLIVYAAGSYAQYMILDSVAALIGILFSLIIVRVGLTPKLKSPFDTRRSSTPRLDSVYIPSPISPTYPKQWSPPSPISGSSASYPSPRPSIDSTSLSPPLQQRQSPYRATAPTRPLSAHVLHQVYQSQGVTCTRSPPLPPLPVVINISKETCYDYDYDTRSYTKSVESDVEERYGWSSEKNDSKHLFGDNETYYASSWTGSDRSLHLTQRV